MGRESEVLGARTPDRIFPVYAFTQLIHLTFNNSVTVANECKHEKWSNALVAVHLKKIHSQTLP